MTPLTAQQTLDRAREVLKSGRSAGLPELIQLIETLSTDIFKVNLDELSELIEKDTTILAKVITVANTIRHNPGIAPVATMSQAIHQVGFHRIRSLAVSLMLIENTGGAANPPEQREAAALALTSGLIAQSCAEQLGNLDPDLAFAAATLRHFGAIVMPAVSLEHTKAAMQRTKTKPYDIAYRGVFGVTPIELTRKLLAGARLPEEVTKALRDCQPESMGGTATQFDTRLLAVADLGSRFAKDALDEHVDSESFFSRARLTARSFDRLLPDACELIEPAVLKTGDRLQGFLTSGGISAMPTASLSRFRQHVKHLLPDEVVPGATPATAATDATAATAAGATPAEGTAAGTEKAVADIPDVIAAPPAAPASKPAETEQPEPEPKAGYTRTAALEDMVQHLGLSEAWLFQRPPGGQSYALALGAGDHWTDFKARCAVRPTERTVFGIALTRGENLAIHDAADPKVLPHLPAWLRESAVRPGAFFLMPLREADTVVGLLFLGWPRAQQVKISPKQIALVHRLLAAANAPAKAA